MILLVPKDIVRHTYYYDTEQYFRSVILERMQQERATYDRFGKEYLPTKKALRKNALKSYSDVRAVSTDATKTTPGLLNLHHSRMYNAYSSRKLSDSELDYYVYERAVWISA